MKRKYFLIGGIILAVIIIVVCIFNYQSLKPLAISPFAFIDHENVCSTDELISDYFLGFNNEYERMNELVLDVAVDEDAVMTDKVKKQIEEAKENLALVSSFISRYSVERALEFITTFPVKEYTKYFEASTAYKKLAALSTKYEKSKEHIDALSQFVDYLNNNQDKYRVFKNTIYYEDASFGDEVRSYLDKLNITLSMEKGSIKKQSRTVPILMYHAISDKPWGMSSLFIDPSDFEEHLKYLKENGYTTYFLDEVEYIPEDVLKPIVLTFDDGYLNMYTEAYPLLEKYGMKATFYIISGWMDGVYYANSEQVKEMDASEFVDIQSHTVSHIALEFYSEERIEKELKESKETLEQLLGKEITSIAYPTGSHDDRVVKIASKYYDYGLLAGGGDALIDEDMDYFRIKRIGVYRGITMKQFIDKVS